MSLVIGIFTDCTALIVKVTISVIWRMYQMETIDAI